MMVETTFTIDELLEALSGAAIDPTAPTDAITVRGLIERTGRSEVAIRRQLRALIEAGRVECVHIPLRRIDGTLTRGPAYRVVKHE